MFYIYIYIYILVCRCVFHSFLYNLYLHNYVYTALAFSEPEPFKEIEEALT